MFLGHFFTGEEIWSKGKDGSLSMDTIKKLKKAMQDCIHIVDRDCTFCDAETDDSEDLIADKIRKCTAISQCPDKRTAIIYEVGCAGVPTCNPSCNIPPFRKEHYERHVRGCLHAREGHSGAKAQALSSKDTFFVYDCKKTGNHTAMLTPFHFNKHKMQLATPKVLLNIF